MNTLQVANVQAWGKHGITGDEREIAQPFSVDMSVQYDFVPAIESDSLADAVDYKVLEQIAQREIEGSSRVLIERLANDIADSVFAETVAQSVEVRISKTRPKSHGIPSVTLRKDRPSTLPHTIIDMLALDHEKVRVFYDAESDGILHFKGIVNAVVGEEKIREWYEKASGRFEKREEKYIQNGQEVSLVYNGP